MLVEKAHKARFVVAISRYNKEYILSRAPNVASDNIRVVHCGVEPEKYQSRSSAPHPGLTAVCVASLQPYKGLKYLVQACHHVVRKVPGFRCLIVGEGADRAELEALIAKLDLGQAVELVGAKAQHEVTRILDEADLFVLPSVIAPSGQMDGIPVALMEAMACGLPVISTRLSGIPELIEDGKSGLLVEPADELVLADAITQLSEKPALRRAFGARAREKVGASFSLSANVDRLRSLFDEASSTAGAPDDLDSELLRWVKSALRSSNDAVLHCKRLGGGRDSEVFEVSAGTGHDPLILKLHRPNWARADEAINSGRPHAENEFRALTALRDAFAREPSNLRVPCPVGFMPEQAALLMEKCTGEKLGDKLRWARLRPGTRASLAGWFRDSGEWLATFHRVSARDGDSRAMFEKIETEFHADLQRCVRRGLSARLGSLARRRFEARKSASFDAVSGLVGRHCDFAPYNMLVSGDRITVIDFEGLRDGIAYEDLCYFLCMLETTPAYHLSRAAVASFRGEFLRGYERHTPLDDAALELFMVAAMANVMAHSPLLRPARGWIDTLKRRQKLRLFLRWFREELA
jgi:Ser/Thr protein kinase RdoA (MazF antagonist)